MIGVIDLEGILSKVLAAVAADRLGIHCESRWETWIWVPTNLFRRRTAGPGELFAACARGAVPAEQRGGCLAPVGETAAAVGSPFRPVSDDPRGQYSADTARQFVAVAKDYS